jgi:CHAT domain-containing protein/Flp pilus assembly protein TadD
MKKFALCAALLLAAFMALGAQEPLTQLTLQKAVWMQQVGNYRGIVELLAPLDIPANRDDPLYPNLLQILGDSAKYMGNYPLAIDIFVKLKDIYEKTLGREHPNYAQTLNNLGLLYKNIGDYARAESCYREAKSIWEKVRGREHPDYAITLSNLGRLYYDIGDYARAESCYREAKTIREKVLGREHPDYATTLSNLGLLYETIGDYARAESHYREAKSIWEKVLGREHPDYAAALNNLGGLYYAIGDYARAESHYREAKNIWEKVLGREHPDYAPTLNNLGELYRAMGDYARAESHHLEAKAIREKVPGKEHPDYATTLNNLGGLYYAMGDYARAESSFLEVKAIMEKVLGREHPNYVGTLNNLGSLYQPIGDYARAESYLLEAKTIREKTLGKEHPDYALMINNLGGVYFAIGDYARAESYLLEAKAIQEKALGREHPDYAVSTNNLSSLYQSMEAYPKAVELKQESSQLRINQVTRNFAFLSGRQRNSNRNTVSFDFEHGYSLSHFRPAAVINGLNYDNTLFSKGLLLRTSNAVRDAIYSSGDPSLVSRFDELGSLRQMIGVQRQNNGNAEYIETLEARAEDLERSLLRDSAAYRDLQADLSMTWRTVQAALKQNEAAVEFVGFRLYDKKWTDTTLYAALVLRQGMEAPLWIPLCNESQLQEQLARVQNMSSAEQARILYDVFGGQLYALIWQPLEKELEGVAAVYYSPAGLLHKISFNALPAGEGGDRLMDKYDLNLVSSTREVPYLARNTAGAVRPGRAAVYGGLKYGADREGDREAMAAAARSYRERGQTSSSPVTLSYVPPADRARGGAWEELPGSREESRRIYGYLSGAGIGSALYQDAEGNEESFKSLDRQGTGIIHLATHGYFLEDIEEKREERELMERLGGRGKAAAEPLLRSGLILAGGNHAWTEKAVEGIEDGILTAAEIAELNLLGTELAVLSACETGLGEVNNGEGVFGLQRAFKLAGVQTLVMSLWEVSDSATSKLMEEFYRRLLNGEGKQEAFKGAQRQVREQYPQPYYWAAFVMMD